MQKPKFPVSWVLEVLKIGCKDMHRVGILFWVHKAEWNPSSALTWVQLLAEFTSCCLQVSKLWLPSSWPHFLAGAQLLVRIPWFPTGLWWLVSICLRCLCSFLAHTLWSGVTAGRARLGLTRLTVCEFGSKNTLSWASPSFFIVCCPRTGVKGTSHYCSILLPGVDSVDKIVRGKTSAESC